MKEEAGFIDSQGRRLFAVMHRAPGGGAGRGAVLVHPFAEEKVIAQRAYVLLARALAARGVTVLRFDLSGHGDSGGEFEDATAEWWLEDVRSGVRSLREEAGPSRVALVGMRLGASLAALAADVPGLADDLALVSPVLVGRQYMDQCLRSNLATQMATHKRIIRDRPQLVQDLLAGAPVNVDGYLIGSGLYQGLCGVDLTTGPPPRVARAVILLLGPADAAAECEALRAAWAAAGITASLRPVADEPPWKDPKVYGAGGVGLREVLVRWVAGEEQP